MTGQPFPARVFAICKHCGVQPGDRGRGLCYRCYSQEDIRDRFPTLRKPVDHRKIQETQNKIAASREAKRLAACGPGELPCCTCPAIVQVNPLLYARAFRVCCPWSLCDECKASVGTVKDGAVGMRGEYGEGD